MKRSAIKILSISVLAVVGFAALAFGLIGTFSLNVAKFHGRDMEPTLREGDLILTTQRLGKLKRSDIVIFKYPADPSQNFVKRIVGLPEEIVEIRAGAVYINVKSFRNHT